MNWKEFANNLKNYWFEILTWIFIAGLIFLAYVQGTHHKDATIEAAMTACESVNRRTGLERYREGYKGLFRTSTRGICLQ